MISAKTSKYRFAHLLIMALLLVGIAAGICRAQETNKSGLAMGELKLEGKHIECLVLQRNDGQTETLNNPRTIIRLPAGEYLLQDVRLKSGYSRNRTAGNERVTISADQQEVLKVGAPLTPTIKVQRQGRILRLSYELLGAGGEAYSSGDRSKPPTFAVYKGQRKIASGQFEFG